MTDELEILFTEAREDLFNIYDEIYVSIWDGSIRIVFGRLGDKYYLAHAGVRLMRILWDLERLYGESLPPLTSQLGGSCRSASLGRGLRPPRGATPLLLALLLFPLPLLFSTSWL